MILSPISKGNSLITLLFSLSIFSLLFLSLQQWASAQRKTAVQIFQFSQALQIAENQKQRQFVGLPCQKILEQNQQRFLISCTAEKVKVRYDSGEISL